MKRLQPADTGGGTSREAGCSRRIVPAYGVYGARHDFSAPVFALAGPLDWDEVRRVHRAVIVRIRRASEKYELDPLALGLPPRAGQPLQRLRDPNLARAEEAAGGNTSASALVSHGE